MNSRSPLYQYYSLVQTSDWVNLLIIPVSVAIITVATLTYGDLPNTISFLVNVVPVVSSILLGFLGMVLVASLSDNSIFEKMRNTPVDIAKTKSVSAYRIFFVGLFYDLILFVVLLAVSILSGAINHAFAVSNNAFIVECFAITLFLM